MTLGSRLVGAWAVVSSFLLLIILISGAVPGAKTLEAEKMVLRDTGGNARISMDLDDEGEPSLKFLDKNGQIRTRLALSPDGAIGFAFNDQNGSARIAMSLDSKGLPLISLQDKEKRPQIRMQVTKEGKPMFFFGAAKNGWPLIAMLARPNGGVSLDFRGQDGSSKLSTVISPDGLPSTAYFKDEQARMSLSISSEGFPMIFLSGENDKTRIAITASDHSSNITCYDKEGKARIVSQVDAKTGNPQFRLNDEHEKTRLALSVNSNGVPALTLNDQEGNNRLSAGVLPENGPFLWFLNAAKQVKLLLAEGKKGPVIQMFNDKKETILNLPQH